MILINSFLCDVLKPEDEEPLQYYELFISQYTSITVSAIISQCSLQSETYSDMSDADLDWDVNDMINGIPEGAERRRKTFRSFTKAMHLDSGKLVQDGENRTFISDYFSNESKKYGVSNRELVIQSLNASAFMNYFILIEDTLKNLYFEVTNANKNQQIGGGEVISRCLRKVLNKKGVMDKFTEELSNRSKFFISFASLEKVWLLLNFIRNQILHFNGYFNEEAVKSLERRLKQIHDLYKNIPEHTLTITMFFEPFYKIQENIEKHGRIEFNDTLENIIRNFSIFVMESIYISEKTTPQS